MRLTLALCTTMHTTLRTLPVQAPAQPSVSLVFLFPLLFVHIHQSAPVLLLCIYPRTHTCSGRSFLAGEKDSGFFFPSRLSED